MPYPYDAVGGGDEDKDQEMEFDGPDLEFHGNPAMTCPTHGAHPNWAKVQLKRDELQTICLMCVHDVMEQHGVHIIKEKVDRG